MDRSNKIKYKPGRFEKLFKQFSSKMVAQFREIHNYATKELGLNCVAGAVYINYFANPGKVIFKIDPRPKDDCIHIAICDEDIVPNELAQYVTSKPSPDDDIGWGHGNWKRWATIKSDSDLRWARQLCKALYDANN